MPAVDVFATQIKDGLKEWYDSEQKLKSLMEASSPLAARLAIRPIGGKNYRLPYLASTGGNVSGDFLKVAAYTTANVSLKSPAVTPATLFGGFVLDPMEAQASAEDKGAFEEIVIARMYGSNEAVRKAFSTALYGQGALDVGGAIDAPGIADTSITLPPSAVIKLDIGMKINISTTAAVTTTYCNPSAATITGISGSTVTFTPALTAAGVVGSIVMIDGGLDASGNTRAPDGLYDWLPTVGDRTGATWNAYIGTSFFGIDRSSVPTRLAGGFYLRQGAETYADAIVQGLRIAKRQGGISNLVVCNDADYLTVLQSAAATQFKVAQGSAAGTKPSYTFGAAELQFAFSKSWVDNVLEDAYCPEGISYILDDKVLKFVALSNAGKIFAGSPKEGQPGVQEPQSAQAPSNNYQMMMDEWISTQPTNTSNGQGVLVSLNVFGNFAIDAPSRNCVVKFN